MSRLTVPCAVNGLGRWDGLKGFHRGEKGAKLTTEVAVICGATDRGKRNWGPPYVLRGCVYLFAPLRVSAWVAFCCVLLHFT